MCYYVATEPFWTVLEPTNPKLDTVLEPFWTVQWFMGKNVTTEPFWTVQWNFPTYPQNRSEPFDEAPHFKYNLR